MQHFVGVLECLSPWAWQSLGAIRVYGELPFRVEALPLVVACHGVLQEVGAYALGDGVFPRIELPLSIWSFGRSRT